MRSFFLITLFSITCMTSAQSQRNQNIWSQELSDDGYFEVLAVKDGDMYVSRMDEGGLFTTYADIDIIRFGADHQIKSIATIGDLADGTYDDLGDIATPEGILHLFSQRTKNGNLYISGQLFTYPNLERGDMLELAKFKSKDFRRQKIIELSPVELIQPIGYKVSRDKTKLALFYQQDRVGNSKSTHYQYRVIDMEDRFGILHEGDFYSDERSDRYRLADIDLSNNGDLNMLLKSYEESNDKEFLRKKPAYAYEVHHLTGDSTEYIYDIKVKDKFIDNLSLGGEDGGVYVAGYKRNKPAGKITGPYFLAIDALGNKINEERSIYRPRDIADMQGKKKDELDRYFQVLDVIVDYDIVYVLKQSLDRDTRNINNGGFNGANRTNNGLNRLDVSWDLQEMVIEGYDRLSGEQLWIETNPRKQRNNDELIRPFAISHVHLLPNGDLALVYNERLINEEQLRKKEKLKTTDVPGDKTMPMIVTITKEGAISYQAISNEKRFYIYQSSVIIDGDDIWMIASRGDYGKFKVGKETLRNKD